MSLSSLVRVANGIGLAGLHWAEALCLVSLEETSVAPPSKREGRMKKDDGVYRAEGAARKKKGLGEKEIAG